MTLTEDADVATSRRPWIGLAVLSLATLLVSLDLFVMLLAVPSVPWSGRSSEAFC